MPEIDRRGFLIATGVATSTPVWARASLAHFQTTNLRVEYADHPLAIVQTSPRFSWQIVAAMRGARQTAYRLTAATTAARLAQGRYDVWDSGRIDSSDTTEVAYAGRPLRSNERIWWRVQIWNEAGVPSAPSAPSWFETGFLHADDWRADWLAAQNAEEIADRAARLHWIWIDHPAHDKPVRFRWNIDVHQIPKEARLLLSAKDVLDGVWLNGRPIVVGSYTRWGSMRDIPLTLMQGNNVLGVEAHATGNAFHPYDGGAVAALLRLTYADGRVERRTTGGTWRSTDRAEKNWTDLDFDDRDWTKAVSTKAVMQCEPWPPMPAICLRRNFSIAKPVASARLFVTALGAYEVWFNGQRIGDQILAPEISAAHDHVFYQKYDVTAQIQNGRNALGVLVGDGYYASAYGVRNERYAFGDGPRRLLAQLEIVYTDGTADTIVTDRQWRQQTSAVLASEIYNGERYDARQECPGWTTADFDDRVWTEAVPTTAPTCRLLPQNSPIIRQTGTLSPVAVTQPRPDHTVVDYGQNFAGWARLCCAGTAGTTVTLAYGEILKADGTVDQSNLRGAQATDAYTLKGSATESYEPHFTYHGFRYVEIAGPNVKLDTTAMAGIVVGSDLPSSGEFQCEHPLLQSIWKNARWSQRANFFAIPTDCPQRDERMGWTGDIAVFIDAATYNMQADTFIRRYLDEVRSDRTAAGGFPVVAPAARSYVPTVSAGWSEAGIILPWTLYRRYGDKRVIEDNWDAMTHWMRFLAKANPDFIWQNARGIDFGDWLAVDAIQPGDETTPKDLIATAYWALAAERMSEMAAAVGRTAEADRYRRLRATIGNAFAARFIKPDGMIGNGSQASSVIPLHFGLVPEHIRRPAAERLASDVVRRGIKLSTGFLGTPLILDALSDNGYAALAVSLLLKTEYPSWGYMIRHGATTMWERWNSDTGDVAMNSYNHYALGAVVGFFYRRLAGIAAAEPGFRKISVRPLFDSRIGRVHGEYLSVAGRIATDLTGDAHGLSQLAITIPPNTTAEIHLPQRPQDTWREGRRGLNRRTDIRMIGDDAAEITLAVESGTYVFRRS